MSRTKPDYSVRSMKFIFAVRELNESHIAPYADCLVCFLRGDASLERFSHLRTYGCLRSLRSRAGKALIRALLRDGALKENYSRVEDETYLIAVDYEEAVEYFASHEILKSAPAKRPSAPFIRIN